jgi:hypothetical protein
LWCGLTENGPSKPYVIEEKARVNAEYYKNRILPFAKRGKRLFGTDKWVYQQYGALFHTSNVSMKWCRNNLHRVIEKDMWLANSPGLNPLDFYFW